MTIEHAKTLVGKKVQLGDKVGTLHWEYATGGPPQLKKVVNTKTGKKYKAFFIDHHEIGRLKAAQTGGCWWMTRRRRRTGRTRRA